MTTTTSSFQHLATHLAHAIAPLDRVFRDVDAFRTVMWRLGWEVHALPESYVAVADMARDVIGAVNQLPAGADLVEVFQLVDKVGAAYRAIAALSDGPPGIDPAQFRAEFGRQLFEHLLAEYLSSELPAVFAALEALGIIAFEDSPPTTGRPSFTRTSLAWERIPSALASIESIPAEVYGWGGGGFDFSRVVETVSEWADALGCPASLDRVAGAFASAIQGQSTGTPQRPIRRGLTLSLFDLSVAGTPREVALSMTELPGEGTAPPGLLLRPQVPPGIGADVDLGGGWSFSVRPGSDFSEELAIVLRPGDLAVRYPFAPGKAFPSSGFGATIAIDEGVPSVIFGDPGGIRVEVSRVAFSLDLDKQDGGLDLVLGIRPEGLALVLSATSLDSFLGSILGDAEARIDVPLAVRWSHRGGFSFVAGAGFEVSIPLDRSVGGVQVERVDLGLRFQGSEGDPPSVALRATGTCAGSVGPIVFSIEGLGIELPVVFADGNAGPFDIRFGVAWPTALGIGVDAEGIVSGGGFLSIDVPAGRYAGVASLQMLGIGLTAMGIIETKLASGPGGWSFFLSVIADFTPVPLGFGFTLNGVGGFMGLHRTLDELALAEGVREGRLDSLLFPEDPIADAPRILADIEAYFPTLPDHHAFGAMAKFGWGTPTLITAELGVIVAVPDLEIAVVGEMAAVLPRADAALLELHMGVVGFIDVAAATFWIAASIYDSQLVGLTLSGDMAMYLSLGEEPYFLLSVGGFHPAWSGPPSVPSSMTALRRMAASIDLGDSLQIGVETYFAVTSNTLQFGAEAFAVARAREVSIDFTAEGWFGFDVLLTLVPFSLVADMSAGVAIRAEGETLAGIQLDLHLEGPEPWYGSGRAEFTFLLWDIPFHVEVGGRPAADSPETIDLWPLLEAALADPTSWVAPEASEVLPEVSLRPLDPVLEPGLWLRPDRAIELRQHVLPLDRDIGTYGALAPVGQTRFDIEAAGLATGVEAAWTPVQDWFAAAQFTALRSTDRLSAPSFELMDAGVSLSTSAVRVTTQSADMASVAIAYEEAVMLDRGLARKRVRRLRADRLGLGLRRPQRALLGPGARRDVEGPSFSVAPTRYLVVDPLRARTIDPAPGRSSPRRRRGGGQTFADAASLRDALDRKHPARQGRLRVVPAHDARIHAVPGGAKP